MITDIKKSKRMAIDAKCKDCNYDSCDRGTWRQQTESCVATDCPLWWHRPASATYEGHEARYAAIMAKKGHNNV